MNRSPAPGFPGLPQSAPRSRPYGTECEHGRHLCGICDSEAITGLIPMIVIREAGCELFGERWAGPLAHLLGLNSRTVQRWANGQNDPPPAIVDRIGELLAIARRSRADAAADRERQAKERATG